MTRRGSVLLALVALAAAQNQPPQPTFRTEANYVRVDVYPSKDGAPVTDLRQEDFEVVENGAPQKIEQFEHVVIRTADLLPFKKGGFIMAIKAQVPIVPVAVQGGRDAMQKGSAFIRPVVVSIRVGEPIETAGFDLDDRDDLIQETRQRIEALLALGPVM